MRMLNVRITRTDIRSGFFSTRMNSNTSMGIKKADSPIVSQPAQVASSSIPPAQRIPHPATWGPRLVRQMPLEAVYVPLLARPELPSGETWERRFLAGQRAGRVAAGPDRHPVLDLCFYPEWNREPKSFCGDR